ncbi:MAG TPA: hypothetical protein VMM37_01660 [Bacteroidota bacterium]|nr:hypothetical protein [Bacteroidota bacterium]
MFSEAERTAGEESFPRALTTQERDLLLWILPEDRAGYRTYRVFIETWTVAGPGRRGTGNYVLTPGGTRVDNESPLPPILAYGVVRTQDGDVAISIRERLEDQVEFEIVNLNGDSVPPALRETGRWTFSGWLPGQACPICTVEPREVGILTTTGRRMVMAFCVNDERVWLHDGNDGVNHLIPLTNFYNELMLHTNTRDPKIALNARLLFTHLRTYTDADLVRAFASYNKLKSRIFLDEGIQFPAASKRSLWSSLRSRIMKS